MAEYLSSVTTNVKGPTRTIHLGPRVVIVGDGGKGKSAIGQSVSLLAGGYADGVDGRNDVKGDRLSRLSAPEPLAVEGIVGGQSVSFRLRDGIKRPENRTPAKQVRAALQAGDDTARKAFLRWAAGDVSDSFVISLVADDLKDLFRRLWTTRQADNAIDRLLAVADFARKTKADRMKEAKGAQKIVDEIQAPAIAATEQDVNDARALLRTREQAARDYADYRQQVAAFRERATIEQRLAEVESRRASLDDQSESFRRLLAARWDEIHAADGVPERVREAALVVLRHDADCCAACGADFEGLRDAYIAEHEEALLPDDEVERLRQNVADISDELSALWGELTTLTGHLRTLPEEPPEPVAEVTDVEETRKHYEATVAARAQWKQIEDARNRAREMKKDAERHGEIEDACNEIITTVLGRSIGGFCTEVSRRLPGWTFHLEVVDGFDWSVDKHDGRSHMALSGHEFEVVVLALADTIAPDEWSVAQTADCGWSPGILAATMKALKDSKTQIIIETTTAPAEEVEGWQILYVEDFVTPVVEVSPSVPTADVPAAQRRFLSRLGYNDSDVDAMSVDDRLSTIKHGRRKT